MTLNRLTERVWIFPFEPMRDRPNLGYIRGDRWSLAVDAGHSQAHSQAFYRALEEAGLPLPSLTVLTHWHWDHTFGMHAVQGLCLAGRKTDEYLRAIRGQIARDGRESFLSIHETIREEYAEGRPVIVTLPDLLFSGEMQLNAGNCPIRIFSADSPHTDDSTLIFAEEEKVLFLGDAACGVFPTWDRDRGLSRKLAGIIQSVDAEICMEGHWTSRTKQEMIDELLAE